VARALLEAAPRFVRERGGRVIEAYPRRTIETVPDEQLLMGPEALFVEHGFVPFGAEAPYPVLRKALGEG